MPEMPLRQGSEIDTASQAAGLTWNALKFMEIHGKKSEKNAAKMWHKAGWRHKS